MTGCWTFVDTVEEEVLSHLEYYVFAFCLKITDGRPWGTGNTVIQHVIWSVIFTKKWLPTIPIIKPSKFVSTKEEPIPLFSCLKFIAYHTNPSTFKMCINGSETVGIFRVIWGWELLWTREHKDSVGEFIKEIYST